MKEKNRISHFLQGLCRKVLSIRANQLYLLRITVSRLKYGGKNETNCDIPFHLNSSLLHPELQLSSNTLQSKDQQVVNFRSVQYSNCRNLGSLGIQSGSSEAYQCTSMWLSQNNSQESCTSEPC